VFAVREGVPSEEQLCPVLLRLLPVKSSQEQADQAEQAEQPP